MSQSTGEVAVDIPYQTALQWIAGEAAKPEGIWERLYEACRAEYRFVNARDWELEAEATQAGVRVSARRKA